MLSKLFTTASALTLFLLLLSVNVLAQKPATSYDLYPLYTGKDLGIQYRPGQTAFTVWAPMAEEVVLRLYASGHGEEKPLQTVALTKSNGGSWRTTVRKNLKNVYYTFQVKNEGAWLDESADPYAKAVGANGRRGMVVNLAETNPVNWNKDKGPVVKNFTDIVLYESHVRDISIAPNSGIKNKGKFLGFAESGTRSAEGLSTGLDHLKELGITHLHLLPSFDFNSVDETKPEQNKYNWGYDPLHYNVPEGSFSSNPYDGRVRIREFKQMVQALHKKGIGVVLDVVYNHTSNLKTPFNQFAPGYYYRQSANGKYSDASACGNETASERSMMRKFMLESVLYWVKEYHIDGFRFDLMGIHDTETMKQIRDTLRRINPSIFIYGEGWTAGASPLPEEQRAVKKNTYQLETIAAFSDDLRDALRGPYSNSKEKGFVSGKTGLAESLKFGVVASTRHPQVDYARVNYSKEPWALQPFQSIAYASCHDDPTLYDRLKEANPDASEEALIRMDRLAQTAVFTAQGVPFLHSGAELLRTKQGVHNSYQSPDSINQIDWSRKATYKPVYDYYKALLALRRNHPSFRLPTTKKITEHLQFLETADPLLVAYTIKNVPADSWNEIVVLLNGDGVEKVFELPKGMWTLAADGNTINEKGLKTVLQSVRIPATTAYVLFRSN